MPAQIPEFLENMLNRQYGAETAARIMDGYAQRRPVTLRANTLKTDIAYVKARLDAAGIGWREVPWYPDALILEQVREPRVRQLELYENGEIYLQSLSSMIPPLILAPRAGECILDMAAAPGGKTTQMAALSADGFPCSDAAAGFSESGTAAGFPCSDSAASSPHSGRMAQITACEKNFARCERLRFNLERQGAGGVLVMNEDARKLDPFFSFDKILLDAPCSGSGTLCTDSPDAPEAPEAEDEAGELSNPDYPGSRKRREKSGGKTEKGITRELIDRSVRTQEALLRKALQLLKPGHEMVYSTCSVLEEENERVLRHVLPAAGAKVVPVGHPMLAALPLLPVSLPGTLCVCPTELYEGFFVAKIRKQTDIREEEIENEIF